MIQRSRTEQVVSLADLHSMRHVNWEWARYVMGIYDVYLELHRDQQLRLDSCPLLNLRRQLSDGWVGALLVEGPRLQLIGVLLGKVEHYLDSVSVYVAVESLRSTRRGDEAAYERRSQSLREATLRQVVWHHLCFGEEVSSTAPPRVRNIIFWRRAQATTEEFFWDSSRQQLSPR